MSEKLRVGIFAVLGCVWPMTAQAWWGDGHGILTRGAILALPVEVPSFFTTEINTASNVVFDPDLFRNRGASTLYQAEHGEHYFDLEYLEGRELPAGRYDFIRDFPDGPLPETVSSRPCPL